MGWKPGKFRQQPRWRARAGGGGSQHHGQGPAPPRLRGCGLCTQRSTRPRAFFAGTLGPRWSGLGRWCGTNGIERIAQGRVMRSRAWSQPAAPSGRCPARTMWLWLTSPGPLPVSAARGGRPPAHRAASSHSLHPGDRATPWALLGGHGGLADPSSAPQQQGTGASLASLACCPPRDSVSRRGWQSCGPRTVVASGIRTESKSGFSFFLPEPPPPALSFPAGPPAPAAAVFPGSLAAEPFCAESCLNRTPGASVPSPSPSHR